MPKDLDTLKAEAEALLSKLQGYKAPLGSTVFQYDVLTVAGVLMKADHDGRMSGLDAGEQILLNRRNRKETT